MFVFGTKLKRDHVLLLLTFVLFTGLFTLALFARSRKSVKMPAGVSWPRYLRMLGASVLAMFAGAQTVHQYYLPDLVKRLVCLCLLCRFNQ